MKRIAVIPLLVFFIISIQAQPDERAIITSGDSLYIENLLQLDITGNDINEYISFYARQLHGIPYASGTLDIRPKEGLIVNVHELDCTTFVETVLALSITRQKGLHSVQAYEKTLRFIRYHKGIIDGYSSRLHYFSAWISDNTRKGLVQEITADHSSDKIPLQLYFMTAHTAKYPLLEGNPAAINRIREYESGLSGDSVFYIPKEKLPSLDLSWIKEGDIIAITTGRPGLDITHVGIACVIDGAVHLMHSSLKEQKVITDSAPLPVYLSRYSSQTGIRVIRALNQRD